MKVAILRNTAFILAMMLTGCDIDFVSDLGKETDCTIRVVRQITGIEKDVGETEDKVKAIVRKICHWRKRSLQSQLTFL
ncbi:MAG: hypothetical protein AAF208_14010 [Cyanobacteria bacterium P01_A01_bin.45]